MFANGSEYDEFMEDNCYQCPMFVHWEDETEEKSVCPIEQRIAEIGFLDFENQLKTFPFEWLDGDGLFYHCRRRLGKKRKFLTADQLPKKPKEIDKEQIRKIVDALKSPG